MRENFSISEILEAVDLLLDQKIKKKSFIEKKNKILPGDTEKIIAQAEKYLKKNT